MKNCMKEGCESLIDEAYTYCLVHHKENQKQNELKKWHDDPLVDQLMKINANLHAIKQSLMTIAYNTSKEEDQGEE